MSGKPSSPAPLRRLVGQPLYAVFGRHERRGVTQMSIPLQLDEAKQFMKFAKCYAFYTKRRIRRLPNAKVCGPAQEARHGK